MDIEKLSQNDITSAILDEIQHNSNGDVSKFLDPMSPEQLDQLYIKLKDPFAFSLPGNHSYTNMSYINIREQYLDKFNTISMIAFLFRSLDEYKVPDECEPVSMENYKADPSIIEPNEHDLKDTRKMSKIQEHIDWMKIKIHIYDRM